jgi:hypothetical protein
VANREIDEKTGSRQRMDSKPTVGTLLPSAKRYTATSDPAAEAAEWLEAGPALDCGDWLSSAVSDTPMAASGETSSEAWLQFASKRTVLLSNTEATTELDLCIESWDELFGVSLMLDRTARLICPNIVLPAECRINRWISMDSDS